MTPTPEQLALARRIAGDRLTREERWLPGVKAGIYEEIIAGKHDSEPLVQSALAAIIETSERAAKLCDEQARLLEDSLQAVVATGLTQRLRDGAHLKGDGLFGFEC